MSLVSPYESHLEGYQRSVDFETGLVSECIFIRRIIRMWRPSEVNFETWLTRAEVARELSISTEYVQYLAKNGRLAFTRLPFGRVYDPASVQEAKANRVGQMRRRSSTDSSTNH